MKTVGILIVNYGAYQDTVDYVYNLKKQEGVGLSIIIVDNLSPDGSFEKLSQDFEKDPIVEILQAPFNGGYAYGNNFGLRHWQHRTLDFIVISNNDIFLDDTTLLMKLVAFFPQLDSPAFIAPAMYVQGKEDQKHQAWKLPGYWDDLHASLRLWYYLAQFLGKTNRYRFKDTDLLPQAVQCLSGSFFMGQKSTFYQLGLFDEQTFLYGEESILGQKVKQAGLENYLIRSLHFHHVLGKSTRRFFSMVQLRKYWLQSTLYYQKKYNGIGTLHVYTLRLLLLLWIVETTILQFFRAIKVKILSN